VSIDLTAQKEIQTNLFVRIVLFNTVGVREVATFSDYHSVISIDGVDYAGLGSFLSITATNSNLRITPQELTIGISGIPVENIASFLTQDSRGAEVQVLRGIFNPVTGSLLPLEGNPTRRFSGIVDSYSVTEDYAVAERASTMTIQLNCASRVSQLLNLVSGRATNPWQQQELYPGDRAFDRVPNIANANYNFGAP
jgi:hypothetical protein